MKMKLILLSLAIAALANTQLLAGLGQGVTNAATNAASQATANTTNILKNGSGTNGVANAINGNGNAQNASQQSSGATKILG